MAESWRMKDLGFLCSVYISAMPSFKDFSYSCSSIWSWIQNTVFRCLQCGVPVFQALKHLKDVKALRNINESMKKKKKERQKQRWYVLFLFFLMVYRRLKMVFTSAVDFFL